MWSRDKRNRLAGAIAEFWRWPLFLLGGAFVAALVAASAVVLLKLAPEALVPKRTSSPTRAQEISDVRTALLALLGGLIAIAGAIYTVKTFRLSKQRQVTDRLTRAIDQMDSDAVDIRLGGILALERLGREAPAERGQIMDILAGFVRERSATFQLLPPTGSGPQSSGADVQAAVRAIGRRDKREARRMEHILDLSGVDLRGAKLVGGNYSGVTFDGAHLEGADLSGADLAGSTARGAHLDGADMTGAILTDALLIGAHARSAELRFAELRRVNLRDGDLRGANLFGAKLEEADLWKADLSGARLWNARLEKADLTDAILDEAQHNTSTVWPKEHGPGSTQSG
jgi:hypothetical protein